jgi:hypothetical protein
VDIQSDFRVEAVRIAQVPQLERVGERFYINLWPENLLGLAVDGDLCEVPHICAWNSVLVESTFYPFPDRKQPFPILLSDVSYRRILIKALPLFVHTELLFTFPLFLDISTLSYRGTHFWLPFPMLHDMQDIVVWKYLFSSDIFCWRMELSGKSYYLRFLAKGKM